MNHASIGDDDFAFSPAIQVLGLYARMALPYVREIGMQRRLWRSEFIRCRRKDEW